MMDADEQRNASSDVEALTEALREIAEYGDRTLISMQTKGCNDRGINLDYSDGANDAFAQMADIARAALREDRGRVDYHG